ncbi:hypothetical protein SUGI_0100940 [Cryptomeria japonica]|uniref:mavicyanin n=1 Tax=Cryptomeria japonica TaxID=3369 RepID=UPI002408A505|nr:mavicyanin [Cryptomeria japonica]GLJ09055.1 hypothetical protein SUGI_0100940 [Cryptomeria japonica]
MALGVAAMAALLILCACNNYAEATDYTVGDGQHWGFGVNYGDWASSKTFHAGDNLVFTYASAAHNVLEVQQSAYDSCATSNPIHTYTGGNTQISLTSAGTRYFICGFPGHCAGGMKVAVTVSAGSSFTSAPSKSSAPAPAPNKSSAPAPSPSTKSPSTPVPVPEPTSAGHVSQMKDMLGLLFASLISMSFILA